MSRVRYLDDIPVRDLHREDGASDDWSGVIRDDDQSLRIGTPQHGHRTIVPVFQGKTERPHDLKRRLRSDSRSSVLVPRLAWFYSCLISWHTHLSPALSSEELRTSEINKLFGTSPSILQRRKLKAYICPGQKGVGTRGCQRGEKKDRPRKAVSVVEGCLAKRLGML